ncbi:uncharacterized protein K460DRAFT_284401 [Cucurbitaria berberidis CBS 394.84]|uniref:Uncharacterized protein n=1 Tax=Cucurbitaria berberidis CBS 394.84 TaxID=1168544 RepID=A0A9P4GHQ0_9PLEO|nr:uncharacterized protein K460DRAFT_284401 [Cucurbitaria berberidis CBS 394.84]KAF1846363.1 hypothetical protein K460DRAFT_284401 [Cucurbitaria berberidis CBS 394.84]
MTPAEKLAEKVKKYFSDKMKKAGLIIREQKKQTDPASQLGANVSIVDSANGVTITGVYWKAPTNDDTIPSTQAQINKCVQKLVEAIRNNHECREKDDSKIFQNRWADSATYYTVPEMKAVAQEVMTTMIDVHRNGWTKSIYDKEQRDLLQKTMLFTFKERFDCLVELLMCSKTTCQDLMKGERHYSIIGNPYALTNRTKSNKASNETKEVRIADGAEVESLRRAANGEESLPKAKGKKRAREEDENDVQARLVVAAKPPNKRARKNVQ